MRTETCLNRFLGRLILMSDSVLKLLTILYVDVKEPAPRSRGRGNRIQESLPFFGFKTVVIACCCCLPMVGVTGFEPVTLRLSSACSNQLSYTPGWLVEAWGFEPQTYSLQSYRSTN